MLLIAASDYETQRVQIGKDKIGFVEVGNSITTNIFELLFIVMDKNNKNFQ